MPLVFTAIAPNAPELALEAKSGNEPSPTLAAVKELEGELYFMKPDTIVLLSEHGGEVPELINATISGRMKSDSGELAVNGDVELTTHLKEVVDTARHDIPMTIVAPNTLAPEVAAPLGLLTEHLQECKVVVVSTATLPIEAHLEFGRFLHHELLQSNKRIAIIAAGHFGPNTSVDAQSFSALVLQAFEQKRPLDVLSINEELARGSGSDIRSALAVLLGIMEKLNIDPQVLSKEVVGNNVAPVVNFVIQ